MNLSVGIDLGSTTTKAVILDEEGQVVGRGITNSRSSYDVACQVALAEAVIDTRFRIVASELERAGGGRERREELLAALGRAFRAEQHRRQLARLRRALEELVHGESASLRISLERLLERLDEDSGELERSRRRSDFFRDLAGSAYLRLAEEEARRGGLDFDTLAGLYDKAILRVENTPAPEDGFQTCAAAALGRLGRLAAALEGAVERAGAAELQRASTVGTGYGRQRLPFPKEQIRSEILCHGLGAHAMFPRTRTVLDIGGQDTKAIQVDEDGIVTSFQMNDRCAAGCGRYLGYIADEMHLGLHELGPLAARSRRPARINSTCTVFAGAELRERLSLGEKREDILAGLHRAIILRAVSLLARSGGVANELTFTGGVARNPVAVGVLRQVVTEHYGPLELNTSADSIYTGALGAALFAWRASRSCRASGTPGAEGPP